MMLAIVPGYGDSSEESSNESESEGESLDIEVKCQASKINPPLIPEPSPKTTKTGQISGLVDVPEVSVERTLSDQTAPANHPLSRIKSADDVGRGSDLSSGYPQSCSGLSSEQTLALKCLALKRRKDEELRELEEAERLECRRMARKRRKGKGTRDLAAGGSSSIEKPTEDMNLLSSYMGVNDHLRGALVDHGDLGPKSDLEKEIDQAVAAGDIDKAEHLSNYLASRNFGVRVAEAANARDYAKRKQEEEEKRLAKKKQKKAKLAWGFEVKHRWEMKGNM